MLTIFRKTPDNIHRSYKPRLTNQFSQKSGHMSDKTEMHTLIPLLTYSSFFSPH